MARRVAGSRRTAPGQEAQLLDGASAAVAIVQGPDGSLEFRVESYGPMERDEIMGALGALVDETRRGTDRAVGLW